MCECHVNMNAVLKEHNAELMSNMLSKDFRAVISTYKVEEKKRTKKPPYILASYCPFCGEKYQVEAPLCGSISD